MLKKSRKILIKRKAREKIFPGFALDRMFYFSDTFGPSGNFVSSRTYGARVPSALKDLRC
jgi:hypothetical protein